MGHSGAEMEMQTGISTFDLGELDAGTGVEIALMTPAAIRLLPANAVTPLLSAAAILRSPASFHAHRTLSVPRKGRWRLLIEHADERKKGGCSIRLHNPMESF